MIMGMCPFPGRHAHDHEGRQGVWGNNALCVCMSGGSRIFGYGA
jgi:hypothetical protein